MAGSVALHGIHPELGDVSTMPTMPFSPCMVGMVGREHYLTTLPTILSGAAPKQSKTPKDITGHF